MDPELIELFKTLFTLFVAFLPALVGAIIYGSDNKVSRWLRPQHDSTPSFEDNLRVAGRILVFGFVLFVLGACGMLFMQTVFPNLF